MKYLFALLLKAEIDQSTLPIYISVEAMADGGVSPALSQEKLWLMEGLLCHFTL